MIKDFAAGLSIHGLSKTMVRAAFFGYESGAANRRILSRAAGSSVKKMRMDPVTEDPRTLLTSCMDSIF
jgi:hypothetical protein